MRSANQAATNPEAALHTPVTSSSVPMPPTEISKRSKSHSTSSDLLRKRASVGDKFAVDSKGGIKYLRQHQEDQAAYEQAETIARTVGIIIANALGVHLVKTQVDDAALP